MIDRKTILLKADKRFRNHAYLDETLELLDHCVKIANETSEEEKFSKFIGLEDSPVITLSLRKVYYKKFLRDTLDLSNENTSYFIPTFVWRNHVEDVLRWFIDQT